MLFKVEYIQKVENRDPLVIFQETVDEPNLDAAKDRAARRLKNSQIAEHIPVVIFIVIAKHAGHPRARMATAPTGDEPETAGGRDAAFSVSGVGAW